MQFAGQYFGMFLFLKYWKIKTPKILAAFFVSTGLHVFYIMRFVIESGSAAGDKAESDDSKAAAGGSDWLHDWGVDTLTTQLQSKVCKLDVS